MRATGIFTTQFMWISDKNKEWIHSHFWSSLHKALPLCRIYSCKAAMTELIIIKCKKRCFLKIVENILRPVSSTNRWSVKKSSIASIPLVVLDYLSKVNCFLLIFYSLYCFHYAVLVFFYSFFRGLRAFIWFHHRQKCHLRFVMGRLHVSTGP